ncbi:MAG: Sua5/YciO/YrdC/YwlC family protein [Pseudomonadota bacterium]
MFEGYPIEEDAARVFKTVQDGGVAIFPVSVGYAIVGHSEEAIQRAYRVKQRSFEKPCGNFGDWELFNEMLVVSDEAREMVRVIIQDHDLPFSVVAPFREDHPVVQSMPPFTFKNATKAGTMDLLMNAGPLHNQIARLARENNFCVSGSSANVSLTGSKFRLEDVQDQVRDAADLQIDYGLVPFHNPDGLGSTIVDLTNFKTVRVGCVYDRIAQIILDECGVDLKGIMAEDT